jgi:hypothetical protein
LEEEDDTGYGSGEDTASPSFPLSIYINEFMASNVSVFFEDMPSDYTPDWIELYNPSDEAIDLTGYTITDDLEEPGQHILDGLRLEARGHLVLFADGDPETGPQHLGFKLDMDGESIGLYSDDGSPLDRIDFTGMMSDLVAARIPDGGELMGIYESTPGEANPTEGSD